MAGQFWLNNQINESFTWSVEFGGVNVIDHPVHFSHGITPIELISGESSKKTTKRTRVFVNSDKGEYKARLNLVHTDRSLLEKVSKNFGLVYSIKLTKPIETECSDKKDEARDSKI